MDEKIPPLLSIPCIMDLIQSLCRYLKDTFSLHQQICISPKTQTLLAQLPLPDSPKKEFKKITQPIEKKEDISCLSITSSPLSVAHEKESFNKKQEPVVLSKTQPAQTSFSNTRHLVEKSSRHLLLLEKPLSDFYPKWMANQWKRQEDKAQIVLLFSLQASLEEKEFLLSLVHAMNLHIAPTAATDATDFTPSSLTRLILLTPDTERLCSFTPSFLLKEPSFYLKTPGCKRELWQELQQRARANLN